ncbi:tRNA wybutosine-synthesizing protein [Colletotrichum orchidophilum]|uniref:tRNA(Phe) 7-[(3-amino-3-carboxypropyl)-4-demethylwyosine(37)-N(4)]-methyltransferase n=1 Tax=Colletotrichum orchidophilum TaxID=1209926 RepID=A0A1G4BEK4_9PEZI|nr:tRNA wybutosine-synthesizing protein [Colletotrichum orchidophilum]OHE99793.1 tRNA wybutosine-synthesizing protein [Colletotrichum orchidophilum]
MAPQQRQQQQQLPVPPATFTTRKHKILEQLSVPDAEYTDASPKGSVDVGIRELIDELNALDGFVTTSSCAGRVSVFLEGRKAAAGAAEGTTTKDQQVVVPPSQNDEDGPTSAAAAAPATIAGPGGKGGGGTWLFVSHDPVSESHDGDEDLLRVLGLVDEGKTGAEAAGGSIGISGSAQSGRRKRLVHFKFEPMILHVLTASLAHAQLILKCALAAGFRESGALNLLPSTSQGEDEASSPVTPMVGVRTMGLALESLIGYVDEDEDEARGGGGGGGGAERHCTVTPDYLRDLLRIANERFVENAARIARFRAALQEAVAGPPPKLGEGGAEWEDADARRERKKAEGLRRKEEVLAARQKTLQQQQQQAPPEEEDPIELLSEI